MLQFPARWIAIVVAALACAGHALAFEVGIRPGSRALYLQVGAGTVAGAPFASGGTPGDNPVVNRVSVTVAPAAIAAGPVPMVTDSPVANSPYDGRPFCAPNQVYVGGFFRRTGGGLAAALLSVSTTTASLVNAAGDTLPFSAISWTSGGIGDAAATIPSGSFTGGTQALLVVPRNTWFESCLSFVYANAQFVAAGTFSGRAVYTLSAP